jgi:DNA-binding winged helix-turn-helix (wHTH) protein
MSSKFLQGFRLGPWTVEPLRGAVTGPNGETQHLEPKVMDVFVCLAEHVNQIVTRKQLLDTAWNGSTGSDEQLTRAIGELRRVLHDSPGNPKYIETIPKRGYRLIEEVRFAGRSKADSTVIVSESAARFSGRKLGFVAVTLLALVFFYIVTSKTSIDSTQDGTSAGDKSIAVLPLVNLSHDPDTEYFSDGLSGDILNLLAKVP